MLKALAKSRLILKNGNRYRLSHEYLADFLHLVKGGHRRKSPMTEKEVRRRVSVSIFIIGMYLYSAFQ
jgi:hypothetical protein